MTNALRQITNSCKTLAMPLILTLVIALGSAAPAFASPRLVRIIWDVGRHQVYFRIEARATPGQGAFIVPRDAADAQSPTEPGGPFSLFHESDSAFLKKGDKVRVYVVNYNPVSHAWSDASLIEQVALAQSVTGAVLNAMALAISGAGKFPAAAPAFQPMGETAPTASCAALTPVQSALTVFGGGVRDADAAGREALGGNEAKLLREDAKKVIAAPATDDVWSEFDDASAWAKVRSFVGRDFTSTYAPLKKKIDEVDHLIDAANIDLLALDRAVAGVDMSTLPTACTGRAQVLLQERQNLTSFLQESVGAGSQYLDLKARFQSAAALWAGYESKLSGSNWRAEAVEVVVKDLIQADAVLRADAVFVSTDKGVTDRLQRSLVLEVAQYFPTLLISSGVGFDSFHFKKLVVVKATTTAADGSVSAKNQFRIDDDNTLERIIPVWTESIRIWNGSRAAIYGTFGTTPDRNIFKNAIFGGSVYVPRWRTAFTLGRMMARGYKEQDLTPIVSRFSDSAGFVLADVTAANVPLPSMGRKYSPYFSVSFVLASF